MMQSILSFAVTEWLGTLGTYLVAGGLAAGGLYLAGFAAVAETSPLYPFLAPLRKIGLGLIAVALVLASAGYFKHVGAAACESAWKQKNLETRIADLEQETKAWRAAADINAEQLRELAHSKEGADRELSAYRDKIKSLAPDIARARLATPDDRRRLCAIVGNRAPGCAAAGDLRSN